MLPPYYTFPRDSPDVVWFTLPITRCGHFGPRSASVDMADISNAQTTCLCGRPTHGLNGGLL